MHAEREEMKAHEFFFLLAAIYMAPSLGPVFGTVFGIVCAVIGLGFVLTRRGKE